MSRPKTLIAVAVCAGIVAVTAPALASRGGDASPVITAAQTTRPQTTDPAVRLERENTDVELQQARARHDAELLAYFTEIQRQADEAAWYAEVARQEAARREAARQAARRRAVVTVNSGSSHVEAPTGDIWARLAQCETGMRNDTGDPYWGYFQFTISTWHSIGMSGRPSDYDYGTQLVAAQRLQARSGWGQWPGCARHLGLI